MTLSQSWYEVALGTNVGQGEFFPDFSLVLPANDWPDDLNPESIVDTEVEKYDVVVLSQSCDLVLGRNKIKQVVVARYWPLSDLPKLAKREEWKEENLAAASPEKQEKRRTELAALQENIRCGNQPNFHMIAESWIPDLNRSIQIVDFRKLYFVPFDYLMRYAQKNEPRLRLKPPYGEHLSQAFARYFMRVGLPSDIPQFKPPK